MKKKNNFRQTREKKINYLTYDIFFLMCRKFFVEDLIFYKFRKKKKKYDYASKVTIYTHIYPYKHIQFLINGTILRNSNYVRLYSCLIVFITLILHSQTCSKRTWTLRHNGFVSIYIHLYIYTYNYMTKINKYQPNTITE